MNWVAGNNLFITARGAHASSGFSLTPKGGLNTDWYIDDDGVNHNTIYLYASDRPQDTILADGNFFKGRHEVKFGFSWRKAVVESAATYPGSKALHIHVGYPDIFVLAYRDWASNTEGRYWSGYIGDTISYDRLTANLGVRIDHANSSVKRCDGSGQLTGSRPTSRYDGARRRQAVRLHRGVAARRDHLRARREPQDAGARELFGRSRRSSAQPRPRFVSAIQYSYAYFYAVDTNGNNVAERSELVSDMVGYVGFDPADPTAATSVNQVDPDIKSPRTHELMFGLDRELMPNFSLSGTFTWRKYNDLLWPSGQLIGVTASDYTQTGTLTGNADRSETSACRSTR